MSKRTKAKARRRAPVVCIDCGEHPPEGFCIQCTEYYRKESTK